MRDMSIGELSAETGVKVPTIRYYEGIGLIDAPARSQGNQRRYDDLRRLNERVSAVCNHRGRQ